MRSLMLYRTDQCIVHTNLNGNPPTADQPLDLLRPLPPQPQLSHCSSPHGAPRSCTRLLKLFKVQNNSHLVSKASRTRLASWSPCPCPSRPPSQWLQQPDHQPTHNVPQSKCNWQTYLVSDDAPDHLVSFLQEGQHWLLVRHPVRLKRIKGKIRKDVKTWINSSSGIQSHASSMVSSRQLEKT